MDNLSFLAAAAPLRRNRRNIKVPSKAGLAEINGACGCAAKHAPRARTAKAAPWLSVSLFCFRQQKWQVRLYLPFLLVEINGLEPSTS